MREGEGEGEEEGEREREGEEEEGEGERKERGKKTGRDPLSKVQYITFTQYAHNYQYFEHISTNINIVYLESKFVITTFSHRLQLKLDIQHKICELFMSKLTHTLSKYALSPG